MTDELDLLAQSLATRGGKVQDPPGSPGRGVDFDPELDLLAQNLAVRGRKAQDLSGSLRRGLDFDPDAYAQAIRTAARTGVAPAAVLNDPKHFDREATFQDFDPAQMVATHPRTAEWASVVEHAALAHDDLPVLLNMESAAQRAQRTEATRVQAENESRGVGVFGGLGRSFLRGVGDLLSTPLDTQEAILNATLGRAFGPTGTKVGKTLANVNPMQIPLNLLATGKAFGNVQAKDETAYGGRNLSQWAAKGERETESVFITDPRTGQRFVNWRAVNPLSGVGLENIGKIVAGELPSFAASAAAAMLTGGGGGVTLAPKISRVGRAAAKLLRYATSAPGLLEASRTVQGQYRNGVAQVMAENPGMTQEEAEIKVAPGALLAGVLSGPTGAAMEAKFMEDLLTKVAMAPGGATLVQRWGSRLLSGLTQSQKEGAQEVVQGFAEEFAEWMTYNPDKTLREIGANALMNYAGGVVMGGGAAMLVHGSQEHRVLQDLGESAEASKLRQRSPEAFRELLGHQLGDSDVQDVRMPFEAFQTLFQDPKAAAERLGATGFAEAAEGMGSGDVTIPTAALVTEFGAKVTDVLSDLRTRNSVTGELDGPTPREQAEWAASDGPAQVRSAFDKLEQESQASPDFKAIRDEMKGRFTAQGETEAVAQDYATQIAMAFMNASRAGLSPMEYFRYRDPEIRIGDYRGERFFPADLHTSFDHIREVLHGEEAQTRDRGGAPAEGGADAAAGATPARVKRARARGLTPEEQNLVAALQAEGLDLRSLTNEEVIRHLSERSPGGTEPLFQERRFEQVGDIPQGTRFQSLDPDTRARVTEAIENEIRAWIANPEGFFRAYDAHEETHGGRLVNGDIVYSLLPTVQANLLLGHTAGESLDLGLLSHLTTLRNELITRAIDKAGDLPVAITAGGQASGKTTLANRLLGDARVGAVIDAPHDDAKTVEPLVWKVLAADNDAEIVFVERPDARATEFANIRRAIKEGRYVEPQWRGDTTTKVPGEMLKLGETFRNQPRVGLRHVQNMEAGAFEEVAGGRLHEAGKDAMISIRGIRTSSSEELAGSAFEAYNEYLKGVADGNPDFPAIPAELQARIEAGFPEHLSAQRGIQDGDHGADQAPERGALQGLPGPVAESLRSLGIDPESIRTEAELRTALDRAEARPELRAAVQALRQNLGGETLFQPAPMTFGSKEWNDYYGLRHGSRAAGDQAKRAREGMRRSGTGKGQASFDELREEELRAAAFATLERHQGGDVQPRGWFRVNADGSFEMGRTKIGDLSTFVHEPGHAYLVMLGDLASREGASEQLRADHRAALAYLGAEQGHPLTTEQQETWARTIEAYVREGKAPTPGLRGVFQRLAIWLGSVYRKASALGVEITSEVRGVLDRWFAASDAVDQAAQDFGEPRLFHTPEEAGWTPEEFQAYAESRGLEEEEAKAQIVRELNEAALRERTDAWREEERNTRAAVEELVNARPEYVAMKALRSGEDVHGNPIVLNRDLLIQEFGEARQQALQALHNGLYRTEGGTDAQTAAELLGYRSGEELLRAMEAAPRRREIIDQETQARMTEKHGDIRWDGTLTDQARIALANERRADNLWKEMQALERKVESAQQSAQDRRRSTEAKLQATRDDRRGRAQAARVTGLEQLRAAAREVVEDKPIAALRPGDYLNAMRRHSREAFKESLTGNPAKALDAKRKELQNLYLYIESRRITLEAEKGYQYMTKFGRNGVRARIAKAGGEMGQHAFLDQIDALLEQFEFKRRTAREALQGLEAFAKDLAGQGLAVTIDPIVARMPPRNYKALTILEMRAVTDAVKNLETLARNEGKVLDGEKAADKEAAVEELDRAARTNLKTKPQRLDPLTKGGVEDATDKLKSLDTGIQKLERVIHWLDGGAINGPWRRFIFDPIAQAQYKERELMEWVTNKLAAAMEQMPKAHQLSLLDQFTIEGAGTAAVENLGGVLAVGGKPEYPSVTVTRKFILAVALNWGNASNRAKLLKGMGWTNRPEVVDRMLQHLTAEDWAFVQGTWNTLGGLWPEIEALQLRVSGVAPERVAFEKFQMHTADGKTIVLDGGYYPVVYDPSKSSQGARQADMDIMNSEGGFSGPITFKGHTVSRIEDFAAAFEMDFERVLTNHITKVIKDISHREAAQSIAKLINDQRVRGAVIETLGPEYEKMFMPWLKGTVNDMGTISPDAKGWQKALMALRSNMVVAGLSFRAGSVLVQLTDFGRASVEVNARYLMPAMWKFGKNPAALVREVRTLSKEMAARPENLDRDVRAMWRRLSGKDGAYARMQKIGLEGLAVADTLTSVTTWKGAYDQALAQGQSQADAIRIADRTVRLVCMSAAPKDQVALQRMNDVGMKLVTMYMGDATATYGMMTDAARKILAGKNVVKSAWTMALVGMLLPIMGDLIKNRGPKEDEDEAWWAAKKALFSLPSSIPIARDIAAALESGQDYKFTPLATTLNKAVRTAARTPDLLDGTVEWDDYFLRAFDAVGGVAGVPGTSQVMTSADYLRRVASGDEEPESFLELATNTVLGKPKR